MKQALYLFMICFSLIPIFGDEVEVVTFVQGKANLIGKKTNTAIKINQVLKKGDTIKTEDGACEIQLATLATVRMEKFSSLSLDDILNPKSKQTNVRLLSGKLFIKAHKHNNGGSQKLIVSAPSYVAGVRGTEFIVASPDEGGVNTELTLPDGVYVNEGTVAVIAEDKKEVVVNANEEVVLNGKELKKQILEQYVKEKMQIFEKLTQMKEENYNLIKDQFQKNQQLLDDMRGKKDL